MTYRRDRSIRDVFEKHFLSERGGLYPQAAGGGERRGPFNRPEDDYGRGGYEYEGGPRFFLNGGVPGANHSEDRGYHGDSIHFLPRAKSQPTFKAGGIYLQSAQRGPTHRTTNGIWHSCPAFTWGAEPRHLSRTLIITRRRRRHISASHSQPGQRGRQRPLQEKGSTFPSRQCSPMRREVACSPHCHSGSSVGSRGYLPERAKSLPFIAQQGKIKVPGLLGNSSPESTASNKEEAQPLEGGKEEPVVSAATEESHKSIDSAQARRTSTITTKALEIEKVYCQDCETFGMGVKMLVAKDPNLEKQLQAPLRENNLGEIGECCLGDLKRFIAELDEVLRLPEHSA